jgi:hypothetical protein
MKEEEGVQVTVWIRSYRGSVGHDLGRYDVRFRILGGARTDSSRPADTAAAVRHSRRHCNLDIRTFSRRRTMEREFGARFG